ncbi:MAG: DMT family transporter [Pseudomonadota bacterium]
MAASPSTPILAALMMIVCCAFIAASTFFAKMLGTGAIGEAMHPFQIVFGRYFFALAALAPFFLASRQSLRGAPLRLYGARAVCGTGAVTGLFAAATLIPLAEATAISFLNPVFAMILAIVFLGERVGRIRWIAAAIALTGGLILIRPGTAALQIGALIALGAALLMAGEIIFAKLLARTEGVVRLLVLTNLIAVCLATLGSVFVWRAPTGLEWGLLIAVGVTMVTAQALFMATIKIADASFATPFLYGTLVFAAAYDFIWFGVVPAPVAFAGAALIVAGAVLLALREARAHRAPRPHAPGAP